MSKKRLAGSTAQSLPPADLQVKVGAVQIIVIASALMLMLIFRPRGLIGEEAAVMRG